MPAAAAIIIIIISLAVTATSMGLGVAGVFGGSLFLGGWHVSVSIRFRY